MVGSTDTDLKSSSAPKTKRNFMEDFLPLYKKTGESNAELKIQDKTSGKHDKSNSKRSPKHERSLTKGQTLGKQAVDVSHITIDGTNLHSGELNAGSCTPLNESKVTSTPLLNSKNPAKSTKAKFKKNASTIEHSKTVDDVSGNFSNSQSHKRTKTVSFLQEENDHAVVKKTRSDVSQEEATGDTLPKAKKLKYKKNKKSEKENKAEDDQMYVDEPATEKKHKNLKKKSEKLKIEETPIQFILDNKTDQEDSIVTDQKLNKRGKKEKKLDKQLKTEKNQDTEKTRKGKKLKHQGNINDENNGEPASKSPKTEVADHLENLNLGDNTHTLTNLIDKMAVVDKAKIKKLRKTANREKKLNQTETSDKKQTDTVDKKQNKSENGDKNLNQNETGDSEKAEEPIEKKKWVNKRWNKHQIAKRDQNTTLNIDNLPVSLLKGNYKKMLIDLFSKYGLSRSAGEAFIINEEDPNPVFTTRIYFDTREAAAEALELDGTTVAGNVMRVSLMRPMTETAIVLRMYGPPEKLNAKDVRATFKEVGLIRSIRPILKKNKKMSTVFVEFDGPEAVQRALRRSDNLKINETKVMVNQFVVINSENKDKTKKNKKRKRSSSRNKKGVEDSERVSKNSKQVLNKNSEKYASVQDGDSSDESDDE